MKKLALAGVFALAIATSANAADMATRAPVYKAPVQQMFNWSGVYAGGYAGWMNGHHQDLTNVAPEVSLNGGAFGGLVGVNWQNGNFVWGLEADGGLSTADAGYDGVTMQSVRDRFVGNARIRAGLAYDRVLLFAAGGAAFTDVKVVHQGNSAVSEFRTGWTIGGGIDYAATQNLILRVEYLYADFGEKNYGFFGGSDIHRLDYSNQNTVRAAAIWKW